MASNVETIDDVQADIGDAIREVRRALVDLQAAESCETPDDLIANLQGARDALRAAGVQLLALRAARVVKEVR